MIPSAKRLTFLENKIICILHRAAIAGIPVDIGATSRVVPANAGVIMGLIYRLFTHRGSVYPCNLQDITLANKPITSQCVNDFCRLLNIEPIYYNSFMYGIYGYTYYDVPVQDEASYLYWRTGCNIKKRITNELLDSKGKAITIEESHKFQA